jgi:hypothetical protein
MFAVYDKVKPDIESIRFLNLVVVKLTTVQVTKLPMLHKISMRGTICFAKPGLTKDFYTVQKQESLITCYSYMCGT